MRDELMIVRCLLLSIALCSLQGCGAPGFSLVESSIKDGDRRPGEYKLGYRPVVEYGPDAQIENGLLQSITPNLVAQQQAAFSASDRIGDVAEFLGTPSAYTIGPGDVVGVIVYDHPELLPNAGAVITQATDPTGINVAPGFIVASTGEISFPYVGRVKIQGTTEIEASELITRRLAQYIKEPQVTVRIQSFRSKRAFVEGEVRTPGLQVFTDVPMTLSEALSRAGGITSSGDRSYVTLSRSGKTSVLNLPYLQDRNIDASSILLKSGDIINVRNREERKVYVMGEIARPAALLMRNGRLTLNEALGEAGGVNLGTANPGQIYVIRNGEQSTPEVFHLDAKNPISLALADRFMLRPRDVVYVDAVPLVIWSRLINLILPAASVVNYGSEVIAR